MPKESKTLLDCKCIDAASIFEIRQGLELIKEEYEEKARSLLSKEHTTEAGRYYWKIRKVNAIINNIKNMKACI